MYTGECTCREGIVGQHCDQCEAERFGFSSEGCQLCECDPIGSLDLQCERDGQCPVSIGKSIPTQRVPLPTSG